MIRQRIMLVVASLLLALGVAACSTPDVVADYWRPISWPNIDMRPDEQQLKLNYDIQLCQCSNFPRNLPQPLAVKFNPDIQRLIETGPTAGDSGQGCVTQPGLVLTECMRARGWEKTDCLGRMPPPGGSQLCG